MLGMNSLPPSIPSSDSLAVVSALLALIDNKEAMTKLADQMAAWRFEISQKSRDLDAMIQSHADAQSAADSARCALANERAAWEQDRQRITNKLAELDAKEARVAAIIGNVQTFVANSENSSTQP